MLKCEVIRNWRNPWRLLKIGQTYLKKMSRHNFNFSTIKFCQRRVKLRLKCNENSYYIHAKIFDTYTEPKYSWKRLINVPIRFTIFPVNTTSAIFTRKKNFHKKIIEIIIHNCESVINLRFHFRLFVKLSF